MVTKAATEYIAYMILPLYFTELIFTSSEKLPKGANAEINGLM